MAKYTIQMILDCLVDIEAPDEDTAMHKYGNLSFQNLLAMSHDIEENSCIFAIDDKETGEVLGQY